MKFATLEEYAIVNYFSYMPYPSSLLRYIVAGFAIFAMFFGAGNLIYPLYIGVASSGNYYWAAFGIMLTGVFLPLLGLFSIILHEGSVKSFFGKLSNYVSFPLSLIIILLIGPIAAIPRCIIISFGGFHEMFESLQLVWFDASFCLLMLVAVWHKGKVVDIIGKWLTPILILGIITIISLALLDNTIIPTTNVIDSYDSFTIGALQGYQTMDLCAAIFFGIIIFEYMKNSVGKQDIVHNSIIASIFGSALLCLVYIFFIYIGSKYHDTLVGIPKEKMLIEVTQKIFNNMLAIPVVSITILIACLTTAIALVDLVSNWISETLKLNDKHRNYVIILVLAVSFICTLFGFNALTNFLANILSILYPALITVTIANIIDYSFKTNLVRPMFLVACIASAIYNFILY